MEKIKIPNIPYGPFPVVIVGANVNGKPNYATLGAYGVVSLKSVLYISLKSTHYTTGGVRETGYFSVNIPSAGLLQKTDYCGMVSGRNADKSEVFEAFYDENGNAPMIKECGMNFLCKVIQTMPMFDFEMFFGEIVAAYVDEDCSRDGKPDPQKLHTITNIGGSYYSADRVIGSAFKEGKSYGASIEK